MCDCPSPWMLTYMCLLICLHMHYACTILIQVRVCMCVCLHILTNRTTYTYMSWCMLQAFLHPCLNVWVCVLLVNVCVSVAVFSFMGLSQGALINILQALCPLDAELRERDAGQCSLFWVKPRLEGRVMSLLPLWILHTGFADLLHGLKRTNNKRNNNNMWFMRNDGSDRKKVFPAESLADTYAWAIFYKEEQAELSRDEKSRGQK